MTTMIKLWTQTFLVLWGETLQYLFANSHARTIHLQCGIKSPITVTTHDHHDVSNHWSLQYLLKGLTRMGRTEPVCMESTSHRWNPTLRTSNDVNVLLLHIHQWYGKCFHVMTLSYPFPTPSRLVIYSSNEVQTPYDAWDCQDNCYEPCGAIEQVDQVTKIGERLTLRFFHVRLSDITKYTGSVAKKVRRGEGMWVS